MGLDAPEQVEFGLHRRDPIVFQNAPRVAAVRVDAPVEVILQAMVNDPPR